MFEINYYGYVTKLDRDVKEMWIEYHPHAVLRIEYTDGNQSGHPIPDAFKEG